MTRIVVPTHGRPNRVITRKLFEDPDQDVTLCVAESQLEAYRAEYPDAEYLVHPDTVTGLTRKRQWIYDEIGDVFMMDDDVDMVIDMTAGPREPNKVRGDRLVGIIEQLEDTARQLGVKVYGFATAGNPMSYKPQRPFRFGAIIQGHCFGMIREDSRLWFHPEIVGTDVDWLACLNAAEHRIMLFDSRYGFGHKDTFTATGGLQGTRTSSTMARDVEILREAFGSQVIQPPKSTEVSKMLGFRQVLPWK